MKKIVTYTAGLIALYLAVEYASGGGIILKAGADGGSSIIKTLQGR